MISSRILEKWALVILFSLGVGSVLLAIAIVLFYGQLYYPLIAFPALFLVGLCYSQGRSWKRLHDAKVAVADDTGNYNRAWMKLRDESHDEIIALVATVRAINAGGRGGRTIKQRRTSLDALYQEAEMVNCSFQALLASWAQRSNGVHVPANLKQTGRTLQKVRRAYGDNCSRLVDLVRGSIVFESLADIRKALEMVRSEAVVVRIKNRFDPSYDASQTAGYRDVCLNLAMPGLEVTKEEGSSCEPTLICELQLQHENIFQLKSDGGHRRYITFRDQRGD